MTKILLSITWFVFAFAIFSLIIALLFAIDEGKKWNDTFRKGGRDDD